jgi:hypothetical protein
MRDAVESIVEAKFKEVHNEIDGAMEDGTGIAEQIH